MAMAQKFTFDHCFDMTATESPCEPSALVEDVALTAPVFTDAELQAACKQASEEGRAAGAEEGRAEAAALHREGIEQSITAATVEIGQRLAEIATAQTENRQLLESHAARIGAAIARKATPPIIRDNAAQSVEALVRDVLAGLIEEPRIAVNVSDALLDEVKHRLDGLKEESGFPGDFIVISDPELDDPNCRIQWSDGGVETCHKRVWAEIDRVMASFHRSMEQAPPDAPTNGGNGQDADRENEGKTE